MDEDISFDKEIVEHFNHKYLEIKQISEHLKSRCQVHRMPNDYFFNVFVRQLSVKRILTLIVMGGFYLA